MNSDVGKNDIYFVYSDLIWVGQVRFFDKMDGQFDIKSDAKVMQNCKLTDQGLSSCNGCITAYFDWFQLSCRE